MAYPPPDTIPKEDPSSPNSLLTPTSRCCCFPRLSSIRRFHHPDDGDHHPHPRSWWSRGVGVFMKIREWSELVAGPKWKTFIRRFNRHRGGSMNGRHVGKFQYDPLSYALNFDEGPGGQNNQLYDDDDDFGGYRDFSSRYASVSGSAKNIDSNTGKDAVAVIG